LSEVAAQNKLGTFPCHARRVHMQRLPRRQQAARLVQLKLFHRPSTVPDWPQLPQEIRQQTVRLLARLLREHLALVAMLGAREASDE
jgi:hypothetical protein